VHERRRKLVVKELVEVEEGRDDVSDECFRLVEHARAKNRNTVWCRTGAGAIHGS